MILSRAFQLITGKGKAVFVVDEVSLWEMSSIRWLY